MIKWSNYIAQYENGATKLKGCFEIDQELHKNPSMRIVPIALKEYYINGTPIEETLRNHKDILDFCLLAKSNRGWTMCLNGIEDGKITKTPLSKITRYFISGHSTSLTKEHDEDGRITGVNVGYGVKIYNRHDKTKTMKDHNVNYQFYLKECNKIMNTVDTGQQLLF